MNEMLTQREAAQRLLTTMFANHKRIAIADAVAVASRQGISRRTLIRAKGDLGAREIHNGRLPGFWELP